MTRVLGKAAYYQHVPKYILPRNMGVNVVEICTIRSIYTVNSLQPSGHYMYHQFNIQQFYVLPTQCIYVFVWI